MINNKAFMDKLYEEEFDVGISEWISDNNFAFLIFHALNLPYVINTKGRYIKFILNARLLFIILQLSRRTHWN